MQPSPHAIRYTLQSLANHQFTRETAHELLSNVTHRLAVQTAVCNDLLSKTKSKSGSSSLVKNLNFLHYLHADTHRLCHQVATQHSMFERWSKADQHVVRTTLEQVRNRHAIGLERWVDVVVTDNEASRSRKELEHNINMVLDILQRRQGIQLLCQHAVLLEKGVKNGAVTLDCRVRDCVEDTYTEAKQICEAHLQVAPDLLLMTGAAVDIKAEMLVKFWLEHVLVELFKNAMKSSVEQSKRLGLKYPTPIQVDIRIEDSTDIVIDIVDEGLGLPATSEQEVERRFGIGHSSEGKRWDRLDEQQSYAAVRSPLSSLGVGLPMSRIMMQHFGGNIELFNHHHHRSLSSGGCTARISLALNTAILEPENAIEHNLNGNNHPLIDASDT